MLLEAAVKCTHAVVCGVLRDLTLSRVRTENGLAISDLAQMRRFFAALCGTRFALRRRWLVSP